MDGGLTVYDGSRDPALLRRVHELVSIKTIALFHNYRLVSIYTQGKYSRTPHTHIIPLLKLKNYF